MDLTKGEKGRHAQEELIEENLKEGQFSKVQATSREPASTLAALQGWHQEGAVIMSRLQGQETSSYQNSVRGAAAGDGPVSPRLWP